MVVSQPASVERYIALLNEPFYHAEEEISTVMCADFTLFVVSKRELGSISLPEELFFTGDVVGRVLAFIGNKRRYESAMRPSDVDILYEALNCTIPEDRILPEIPTEDDLERIYDVTFGTKEDPLEYEGDDFIPILGGRKHSAASVYMEVTGVPNYVALAIASEGPLTHFFLFLAGANVPDDILKECTIGALSKNQCEGLIKLNSMVKIPHALCQSLAHRITIDGVGTCKSYIDWALTGWNKRDRKYANVELTTDSVKLALKSPRELSLANKETKRCAELLMTAADGEKLL